MVLIKSVRGYSPKMGKDCYLADNATLVGNITMGDQCSVWFNAVVRGDVEPIVMGNKVNIQDNATIHGTYGRAATVIGDNVSIAHNAVVHGCKIGHNVLVGIGAIIMDNAEIGDNCIIAMGAVVPMNTKVPSGTVYAGVPAKKLKDLDPELFKGEVERIANNYIEYASWFKNEAEE
ncbi:MAG: gamma carbonic anhydrase family protein [Bacteroidetes bacterium]|nr:gamma carbonic anhydrase family protein [Bacteroidota bacterium]MBT3799780.1 gamma carbonic anhydrase family protein [Bacteroidota bacterium]MBT4968394.1 gamma carbonic anhydrase family protein [Bacteroidota bacterium]MBT5991415.1 gamma carbonic anhydrase family protein [Bacteroidota bacterium]MBT6835772.1 gamma carbonic anhydrase family protein [Bacteroidota bacterium]